MAPSRSGAFSHLASTASGSYPPSYQAEPRLQRRQSGQDQDITTQSSVTFSNTRKPASLPSYSRMYANLPAFSSSASPANAFFVPSYLQHSRYMSKLEEANKAKLKTQRDQPSVQPSGPLLSSSAPGSNIHRMAPSHRGMTYDIIESNPPKEEDILMPLPSRWNDQDRYPGLDITNEGSDLRYTGSASKSEVEAASVRADFPMSPACGIYYYEVEIKPTSKDAAIALGFSSNKASLERLPGWEADSWAYHGDDGKIFFGESSGRAYGPMFAVGDVIGCGFNFSTNQAFFTRNGQDLGIAFRELRTKQPFPSVGLKKYSGAQIRANFGQRPFVFDIDDKVFTETARVGRDIAKTKTSTLHPPLDETSLIQELVAHFLAHDGYVETAKAFAEEIRSEKQSLNNAQPSAMDEIPVRDDADAIHRQGKSLETFHQIILIRAEIRKSILDGHVDQALDLTNVHFPHVLTRSPGIVFRLKCRKWIELIGKASDLRNQKSAPQNARKVSNGFTRPSAMEDVFEQDMELDDQDPSSKGKQTNGANTTEQLGNDLKYDDVMKEAIEYGSVLQREYHDEKGEYKRQLHEMSILLAFEDPRETSHGYMLDFTGRVTVAEELNSAILGKIEACPNLEFVRTLTGSSIPGSIAICSPREDVQADGSSRGCAKSGRWRCSIREPGGYLQCLRIGVRGSGMTMSVPIQVRRLQNGIVCRGKGKGRQGFIGILHPLLIEQPRTESGNAWRTVYKVYIAT